jgi:hypothetical protein
MIHPAAPTLAPITTSTHAPNITRLAIFFFGKMIFGIE